MPQAPTSRAVEISDDDESDWSIRHAKTLSLDDCHADDAEKDEAEVWKQKYADLAARLAKLEGAHPLPESHCPTPKKLFASPSPSLASASATPLPAVPPKAASIPAAKSPPSVGAAVAVPKGPQPAPEAEPVSKAAPPGQPSSPSGDHESLKAGEEELAEQLDLNHEDRACTILIHFVCFW